MRDFNSTAFIHMGRMVRFVDRVHRRSVLGEVKESCIRRNRLGRGLIIFRPIWGCLSKQSQRLMLLFYFVERQDRDFGCGGRLGTLVPGGASISLTAH